MKDRQPAKKIRNRTSYLITEEKKKKKKKLNKYKSDGNVNKHLVFACLAFSFLSRSVLSFVKCVVIFCCS